MRRRSRAGGKSPNAQAPKAVARKSRVAPKGGHPRSTFATNLETEVARLGRERDEALEQQAATSEVLNVISRSTFDLPTALNTLVETAARLCRADKVQILLPSENTNRVYLAASFGYSAEYNEYLKTTTFAPGREGVTGRVLLERKPVQIADVLADPEYRLREIQRLGGFRTHLGLPLLRKDSVIGVLLVSRSIVEPFDDKHIELLSTFAAQAVIAIENSHLFEAEQQRTRELAESLEQQTATSEVLQVISSSPGDLQPVFATMLENAVRICDAKFGNIHRWDGDALHLAATHNTPPDFAETRKRSPGDLTGRSATTKTVVHIADAAAEPAYVERNPTMVATVELGGVRTFLAVPMLQENELIGVFSLARQEVRPFTDKEIALVTSFAAQAVIAIENTRLLNELRQRTTDLTERTVDLTEALAQQTATSEVLRIISSSPGDLEPVFRAMLESATRICEASFGSMLLREGERLRRVAVYNAPPGFAEFHKRMPVVSYTASKLITRIWTTKKILHIADLLVEDPNDNLAKFADARTLLMVPLLNDNELVGFFGIYRQEVRPFTDKQIALLQSFATQAVIAIENARLLTELRESLEQQTATSEVLRVISSSPGELSPVFQAMLENATRICEAKFGNLFLHDQGAFRAVAWHGEPTYVENWSRQSSIIISDEPRIPLARLAKTQRTVHVADLRAEPAYKAGSSAPLVTLVDSGGARTLLIVPMLKEHALVGAIAIYRQEVRPFTDKQIALLQNFAAQAVIAIENARLLTELRQRTDELAQRQAELSVTFDNMGDGVVMFNEEMRLAAWNKNLQEILDLPDSFFAEPRTYRDYMTYLIEHGEFGDVDLETELRRYIESADRQRRIERTRPDGRVLEVRVNPVPGGGFVAIYSDVTERKKAEERVRAARDAAESALRELKAAQDRLVQTEKLASLGQLTAGIAHEIKNPLNFVNNFSAVSVELIDELREALGGAHLDSKLRAEIGEMRRIRSKAMPRRRLCSTASAPMRSSRTCCFAFA